MAQITRICDRCFGKGFKMNQGKLEPCWACGATGTVLESVPEPRGPAQPADPAIGISLLCGAAAAFLAYQNGSVGLGGAAAVAAIVALLVKFTIADLLAKVLGFAVRVLFIVGLIAMVGYCAQTFG